MCYGCLSALQPYVNFTKVILLVLDVFNSRSVPISPFVGSLDSQPFLIPSVVRCITSNCTMDTLRAILYEFLPFTYTDIKYYSKKVKSMSREMYMIVSTMRLPAASSLNVISPTSAAKLLLWVIIWRCFVYVDFGSLWVVLTGIALIFLNLGEKSDPSDLSAYSVFNEGQWRMPGTLTASQFEREIVHNYNNNDDNWEN